MDLESFRAWLGRYFEAWASNDPSEVASLFSEDAVYWYGPFGEPARGRERIVENWVAGGVPTGLSLDHDALALDRDRGIAHWSASFPSEDGGSVELDGILVCDFDAEGRCTLHREWYEHREVTA